MFSFVSAAQIEFRKNAESRLRKSGIFDADRSERRIRAILALRDERGISYDDAAAIIDACGVAEPPSP